MDISDVLELIEEITDFTEEDKFKTNDFTILREDEIETSSVNIKTNTVPRLIK